MKLLDTVGANPKMGKSVTGAWRHYRMAGLSLLPDPVLCPGSKAAACLSPCLSGQGRGQMDTVAAARERRREFFYSDPAAFLAQLKAELEAFQRACHRAGKRGAVRLNVFSDIDWENYGVPQAFPQLFFLDYTKRASRLERMPANYRLIFSYSGRPQYARQVERALATPAPVAVVFRRELPQAFLGRPVIDGDLSDIANAHAEGRIVGLRAKGSAQHDRSGFVVDPDIIATH